MDTNNSIVLAILVAVLLLSLNAWLGALRRLDSGRGLLPFEPRRLVPWGLVDLLMTLTLLACLLSSFYALLQYGFGLNTSPSWEEAIASDDPSVLKGQAATMFAGSVALLVATVASVLLIRVHVRAAWYDFGLSRMTVREDIQLGVVAFVMMAPLVFGLQFLLTQWIPSHHPLVMFVQKHPDPLFLAVSFFAAVVAAPIAEEYLFRVLFQGWVEAAIARYRMPPGTDSQWRVMTESLPFWPSALAIFMSAELFSLMHLGHGADTFPLLVLAIGLGYLYQRTHRILPCIVVHFLLNLTSFTLLLVQVTQNSTD